MERERRPAEPTADSLLTNMLMTALGADKPRTESALDAAEKEVLRRLKRATEIWDGATPEAGEIYDTEAMAALLLIEDEKREEMWQQAEQGPWD